jgi:hypothetical protein
MQLPCGFTAAQLHPVFAGFNPQYNPGMSATQLRREIKKAIDRLPLKQLESVDDFVRFLNRPSMAQRLAKAEKEIAAGKGVNWRKVRSDV